MGNSGNDRSSDQKPNSSPAPPETPPRSWLDEENPFIAFRRYADEQISSMLQSVMGLPSIVTPPFPDKWPSFPDERNLSRQRRGDDADLNTNADRDSGSDSTSNSTGHDQRRDGRRWSDWDDFERWRFHSRRPFDFFGFDSFFDDHFPFGFGRFRPFHPFFSDPFFSDPFFSGTDSQAWPIPYLLFSPYSPLHLERSRERDRHHRGIFSRLFSALKSTAEPDQSEPRWRDAFEDLVRIENGQPMLDRSPDSDSRKETGNEWLRGLVQRGSLGNNWKLIAGPNDNSPCHIVLERVEQRDNGKSSTSESSPAKVEDKRNVESEKAEAETELDLYDRFLQDIFDTHEREYSRAFADSPLMRLLYDERKRHLEQWEERRRQWEKYYRERENWLEHADSGNKSDTRNAESDLSAELRSSGDVNSEPSVVSTLTTRERRTLPDGSVQTKIVKTKRFSDGREESNESVEVVNPPAQPTRASDSNSSASDGNQDGKPGNEDGKPNGGWFWRG
ncbi:hypothetical protein VTN77DRAFT_2643 [Rasamsonia byssochlamydoides]|uniref:uncharacterized protein n=1 Tax=Rasamsonia byssochlamydoides TaxID=89139 RepID=UPI0037430507